MKLVFTKRVENIRLHKNSYEKRIADTVECKLRLMLADLDRELYAGQVPIDFKARIDAIYQDIMGACNYIYIWFVIVINRSL
jgi:hypothetical protein